MLRRELGRVDEAIAEAVTREFQAQGGYFMSKTETDQVARMLVTPQRLPNPALVGKAAKVIAERCGISVPPETRVLVAPLEGVGRDYPLSIEKLCPRPLLLRRQGLARGLRTLQADPDIRRNGPHHGHSLQNEPVILEFGLKKPAFRIVVNTPTTHGSIGLTTGLDPAMTLGCGGYGGNITSDNISPRHLMNIKRLAHEIAPAASRFERGTAAAGRVAPSASLPPAGLVRRRRPPGPRRREASALKH